MMPTEHDTKSRDDRLNEVLLSYVEARQAGQTPDRRALLSQYPEFAAELTEFFVSHDQVEHMVAPLRDGGSPDTHLLPFPESPAAGNGTAGPQRPELGQLGDFQIFREIGRGGMGIVYEAEQISLRRRVALKVLPFAAAFDPKQLARFKNEAQAAAHLNHPGIVPVYAIGSERGVHYYAMQLIDGQSLASLLGELRAAGPAGQPVPEQPAGSVPSAVAAAISMERARDHRIYCRRIAHLGVKAAQALAHAHQFGVVHRDIKPANLLVDVRGELWITDFGLALFQSEAGLTLTGELVGTLRYMSPEQALAKRELVDHRTDIYSLGVTLYELLCLKPVFDGRDREELLRQIALEDPPPLRLRCPATPPELDIIIAKATAKNPAERYATAQHFADDLQRYLDGKPIHARRPSLRERAAKWARRHQALVTSALVLLLLALAGLTVSTVLIARAQAKTKAALADEQQRAQEAVEQRTRAQDGFRQARRALDFITQLSDEELSQRPGLQRLRKKLLAAALDYYQDFIEHNHADPTVQAELATCHSRVAKIKNELGLKAEAVMEFEQARAIQEKLLREHPEDVSYRVRLDFTNYQASVLQGCGRMALLIDPAVAEDLQLTPAQREKVARFWNELIEQRRGIMERYRKLTPEQQRQKLESLGRENQGEMQAILTPPQLARLQQILFQAHAHHAFSDPQVAMILQLTAEQKEQIAELQAEAYDAVWEYFSPRGKADRNRKAPAAIRSATVARILEVLTPEQCAIWKDMTGTPFEGSIYLGPRSLTVR